MPPLPECSLPTESDFDPCGDCLDAQWAWKTFGGLTIAQARMRFLENPLLRQEAFMFMGGTAFAYYFPVIEDYVRKYPDSEEAWILAHDILTHFVGHDLPRVKHLASRVITLADFMLRHICGLGSDDEESHRVAEAWSELAAAVKSSMEG